MKTIHYFMLFVACLFMSACDQNLVHTDNIEEYLSIYMKQAAEYPNSNILEITGTEQTLLFNACYGGYVTNDRDIRVSFDAIPGMADIYNAANETEYELMHPDSYRIDGKEAIIPKGSLNSNSLKITLQTAGYMQPGISYILPVGIIDIDADVPVNENLKVTYFLLTGSYPLGGEPPAKVWDILGRSLVSCFTYKTFLIILEPDGLLNLYSYDPNIKEFSATSSGLNGGWNIFNMVLPTSTGFIGRWASDGNLQEYNVDDLGGIAGIGVTGTGFGAYSMITSSPYHNALFCMKPAGGMSCVQREGTQWTKFTDLGTGWDQYGMITAYSNGILAVDINGDLWFFPVGQDLTVGEKLHAGSRWDHYRRLFSYGTDLLAEDANGILWQYKFDLRGFWEVKAP